MKKILVSLTIVGLVALMSLASMAFAQGRNAQEFRAEGELTLVDESIQVLGGVVSPTGAILQIIGERHVVTIQSDDWDLLEDGVDVTISIVHEAAQFDFINKTFNSRISGQINVGPLSGNLTGTISGKFPNWTPTVGPEDPVGFITELLGAITQSEVNATWKVRRGPVSAIGTATATFEKDGDEFRSDNLILNGKFIDGF